MEDRPKSQGRGSCLVRLSIACFAFALFTWACILVSGYQNRMPVVLAVISCFIGAILVHSVLRTRASRSQTRAAGVSLFLVAFLLVMLIGVTGDPPKDYSTDTSESLREKIELEEKDIAEHGHLSSYLDADRWWPYDRDRTVLGMFLFREKNGRWPESLQEVRESGFVKDATCIHESWQYVLTESGWEMSEPGWAKIAFFRETAQRRAERRGNR